MADDLMKVLRAAGEHLDPVLRQQILASGDAAVGGLISILEDEELALAESAAQGWPPIHAVDLLAELAAVAAIAPMLHALRTGDIDDILSSRVAVRLPKLGEAILEPLLAEDSATEDPERLLVPSEMLSHIPVRDERVWLALSSVRARLDPALKVSGTRSRPIKSWRWSCAKLESLRFSGAPRPTLGSQPS